jgi:hypothetical protein
MQALLGLTMTAALTVPAFATPPPMTMAEGGCGPGFHRDYYGYCRPNGPPPGYYAPERTRWVCPPGWHYGGGRCWPNG